MGRPDPPDRAKARPEGRLFWAGRCPSGNFLFEGLSNSASHSLLSSSSDFFDFPSAKTQAFAGALIKKFH